MLDRETVKEIREKYKEGTRIRLIEMVDPYGLPGGSLGTVTFVDDAGQIGMRWDNGRSLSLIPFTDSFEIVENK